MLRTNDYIFNYIQALYTSRQAHREHVLTRKFEKEQFLLNQGQAANKVYVIKEGIVKCFFNEDNGKDYIVEFLGKGEILGEIETIRNINCLCNVEAITEVTAFAISIPFFQSLLNNDLELNKVLLAALAERIINTSTRASFQQLYPLEHGLARLLELQAKQQISISKEDMAAYLGVSVRSLNRGLKALKS
jgi:CRP/FNR family transcriptional regulator, anaerobic regulatory protein